MNLKMYEYFILDMCLKFVEEVVYVGEGCY